MMLDLSVARDETGALQVSGVPDGFRLMSVDVQEPGGFIPIAGYAFACDIRLSVGPEADKNLFWGPFKLGDLQVRLSRGTHVFDGQVTSMRYGISGDYIDMHVVGR